MLSLKNLYLKLLKTSLHHAYLSLFLLLASFAIIGFWSAKKVKFYLFPTKQANSMYLQGETPPSSSIHFVQKQVQIIESFIDKLPKNSVHSYRSKIGSPFENSFHIQINLIPYSQRNISIKTVKNTLLNHIHNSPTLKLSSLEYHIESGGPPAGKPIEILILGGSDQNRQLAVQKISADLLAMNLSEINSDLKNNKTEYQIIPKEKTFFAGVSPKIIAETLRAAFEGLIVADLKTTTETIDFRVKLNSPENDFQNPLENILIQNKFGNYFPINNLVDIIPKKTTMQINHKNGIPANTISANFNKQSLSANELYLALKKKYQNFHINNPGMNIEIHGEAKESFDTFTHYLVAIIGSIVAIYFLLVIQFNHFLQPFLIISSIPFGIIGILAAFAIQNIDLSMLAMLGILSFGGVVVNNSLIMVEFINRIKQENKTNNSSLPKNSLIQAILDGANNRFRAIFLTTLTTMAGIMPTAYGISGKTDDFISPMVMSLFWGLCVGSIVVIFLIPLLYKINEDISSALFK